MTTDPLLKEMRDNLLMDLDVFKEDIKALCKRDAQIGMAYDNGIECPRCGCQKSTVYDTRRERGTQIRRRECHNCKQRWTTLERRITTIDRHRE